MTPEQRAKALAELEELERNPPTVQLTAEEIASLEAEKRGLVEAIAPRPSDAGRIRGEGTAIEAGPVVPPGWRALRDDPYREVGLSQPALAQRREARFDPPWQVAGTRPNPQRPLGNVDAAVLARLIEAAKNASVQAARAREYVEYAEAEELATRAALDDYMEEHGLR